MRSKNVPASLRGSRKAFPLFPSGGKFCSRCRASSPGRGRSNRDKRLRRGGHSEFWSAASLRPRIVHWKTGPLECPSCGGSCRPLKRTVNPGGCVLSEEGLVMIVFADAGFKLGFRQRLRQRQAARPPAASGLTPPLPPSMRPPSHQCRSMRKRIQRTQNAKCLLTKASRLANQNVSRQTFWYDWQKKPVKSRPLVSPRSLIPNLVVRDSHHHARP